ncbi:MAG: DUF1329 domain-containing protein [Candidatus Binatus sp.]|uniref:DUF1329 domain-containing protein n=1 Tax=Candidatus Binatus sp. TaxID=2811406 RepID=UPI00271D70AF|nr:DUF1329 domain-containing protein [Candidatus Binatus sp.]MDO8434872.1 DUF1329 domain-containing protein [Candidatus Binatus sp.]
MKKSIGSVCPALMAVPALVMMIMLASARQADAQVKPGDVITASNAAQVKDLLSPGAYQAVTKGMTINIVAPGRIDWPPPYQNATEKYASQVRLAPDHHDLLGYVAGQPFPLLDPNDPDVGVKIMWNQYFRPIATDDFDLRFFECQVATQNPGAPQQLMKMTQIGHFAGYFDLGRTEVDPLPADPDFVKTGIWARYAAYPTIEPAEDRGSGGIRYRYWDANRADDTWAYIVGSRRIRRVNEVILSASPGLSTWDADHAGGFAAKPQEYNFKFLGEKSMLGCVHAKNSPAHPCPSDGGATSCGEDWEMRHLYMVEVTPRPERITGILQSKTIVYIDGEGWFNPYVDSYDRKGELWKTQIYLMTYRDRPVPDAKIAVYPFKREFNLAASSVDVQSGVSTTCYLPGPNTAERECWYINMGAVDRDFFMTDAMAKAGH